MRHHVLGGFYMTQLTQAQNSAKRYRKYAAIDRELRAQAAHMEGPILLAGNGDYYYEEGYDVVDEATYSEMGRKTIAAVSNLLDALSGTRTEARGGAGSNPAVMRALDEAITDLNSRVGNIESNMRELSGFIARTDKMLLTMYRQMGAPDDLDLHLPKSNVSALQPGASVTAVQSDVPVEGELEKATKKTRISAKKSSSKQEERSLESRNVPRAEMQEIAKKVAMELWDKGKEVTYSSVAKELNLPYYKVYYACRDDEEFVAMLSN